MRSQLCIACLAAWLVLGHGAGAGAQDATSPGPRSPAETSSPLTRPAIATPAETSPPHEALQPSGARPDAGRIAEAPPAIIVERPGAQRPGPNARWIEGYWDWDSSRGAFAWVTGTWLVPPSGEFWVNGYWRRDANGWYRVPGFWSGGSQVQKVVPVQEVALRGRTAGPSLTRPEEPMGEAPGPDYFYVPGEYIPAWGGVAWRAGYWAASQPGWEWIPAHWERRTGTWVFREGFWNRVPGTPNVRPGGPPSAGSTALASAPTAIGSPPARLISSPGASNNEVLARRVTDAKATETTQSGQGTVKPTQNGASPKPGEPTTNPQPGNPQQPPYASYGPQPAYPYGYGPMWNARSVIGGFLRRVLP
jgi:WXXGXW repeat (2 copies)